MNEIKPMEPIYVEQFDIKINPYLTYAQIQQIVNSIKEMNNWSEKNQAIDMLLLYHATNSNIEELEKIGHDVLLESGLIDIVKSNVKNTDKIYEAIDYTESIQQSLFVIAKEFSKYLEPLEKVVKKHENKSSKKR